MYRGRGGRGGYGRGGFGFGQSAAPQMSDTLLVQISEVRYAVSEDIIQKVFESAGAVTRVYVAPQTNPKEATAVVQFTTAEEADKALRQRNLRHIYENCNKMTISFANWWEHVPEQAVLSSPPQVMQPQQQASLFAAPVPQHMPQHQQAYGNAANAAAMFTGQPGPMATHQPNPANPYAMQQGGFQMPNMQAPAGFHQGGGMQQTPQVMPTNPSLMMQPTPSVVVGAAPQVGPVGAMSMLMGGGAAGFNPMGHGSRGGRGGMSAGGRGGMPAAGGMPMPMGGVAGGMNPQLMALMMMNPQAFMMAQQGLAAQQVQSGANGKDRNQNQNAEGTTVYISVAFYDPELPLQPLFTLLEAFGSVVSIRRNHNRPEIVTVKMATPQDADACCKYLRQVPIGSKTVSAKHFGQYQERHPCTDDSDPTVAATTQFDFTASRHRSPAQRSKTSPSKLLKVTHVSHVSEADLMAYFAQVNVFPENIKKEGDVFFVRVDTLESSVKLLIECQSRVCGEERSNVIFVEDPLAETAAADAAAAAAPIDAVTATNMATAVSEESN
eukprot:CAMPEP_0176463498 /NCGR_PEP_ID=MMETSP0127-20121128/35921_1 /TAXON_ID=938130 /ORGANISM="Platyophrya macrostoma, Strain WH" /LENGTH=551 /DNA_ID=CAMNT_0017855663 /DNA_START=36 /DNA_END=1691 /DNA_ORIENTATION=+